MPSVEPPIVDRIATFCADIVFDHLNQDILDLSAGDVVFGCVLVVIVICVAIATSVAYGRKVTVAKSKEGPNTSREHTRVSPNSASFESDATDVMVSVQTRKLLDEMEATHGAAASVLTRELLRGMTATITEHVLQAVVQEWENHTTDKADVKGPSKLDLKVRPQKQSSPGEEFKNLGLKAVDSSPSHPKLDPVTASPSPPPRQQSTGKKKKEVEKKKKEKKKKVESPERGPGKATSKVLVARNRTRAAAGGGSARVTPDPDIAPSIESSLHSLSLQMPLPEDSTSTVTAQAMVLPNVAMLVKGEGPSLNSLAYDAWDDESDRDGDEASSK
jgi:hypothetical protein